MKNLKLKKGDIIWTPAGEEHWHGAQHGENLTHVSVTHAKTRLMQTEK